MACVCPQLSHRTLLILILLYTTLPDSQSITLRSYCPCACQLPRRPHTGHTCSLFVRKYFSSTYSCWDDFFIFISLQNNRFSLIIFLGWDAAFPACSLSLEKGRTVVGAVLSSLFSLSFLLLYLFLPPLTMKKRVRRSLRRTLFSFSLSYFAVFLLILNY